MFCSLWDLYPMPLRFWADTATVDLLSTRKSGCNRDKVRNLRRELGLGRTAPIIVRSFKRIELTATGGSSRRCAELDDCAAERAGFSAMFQAFLRTLNESGEPGS
jgi:hypothetical protein